MGVCHRDLKPENILLLKKVGEGEKICVKIIDFGLAKFLCGSQQMNTKIGTPYFVSPELLQGTYSTKTDLWALGVVTHFMLLKKPPFNANSEQELF